MSTTTFLPTSSQARMSNVYYDQNNNRISHHVAQQEATHQQEEEGKTGASNFTPPQDTFVHPNQRNQQTYMASNPYANHLPDHEPSQLRMHQGSMPYAPHDAHQYYAPQSSRLPPPLQVSPRRGLSDFFTGKGRGIGGRFQDIIIFDLIFEFVDFLFKGLMHLLSYIF